MSIEYAEDAYQKSSEIPVSFETVKVLLGDKRYHAMRILQIVSPLLCEVEQPEITEVDRDLIHVTRSRAEPGYQGVGW